MDKNRLLKFKRNFGELVGNCQAFNDMIFMLSNLEDKRILDIIITKFWFIEHQRCRYYNNLPENIKSYYKPYFIENMRTIMNTAINHCSHIDITTKMKDENGEYIWACDSKIAYQFNKSRCRSFILNVLSTYFKRNCKA